MAYRDFHMDDLEEKFSIEEKIVELFNPSKVKRVEPSKKLVEDLAESRLITLSTEKALSERMVSPILAEMKKRNEDFLQIFSGEIIKADSSIGLNGEIDFLFSKTPETTKPKNPIFCITEAKIGLIEKAFPQAIAQMIGVRLFNLKKNHEVPIIHGSVTDGKNWRFLKLDGNNIYIDRTEFATNELSLLLGVLQEIINFYKK
jgi:hypothetical protein